MEREFLRLLTLKLLKKKIEETEARIADLKAMVSWIERWEEKERGK